MKEKLQVRLQELDNLQRQALANFNALEGAKQECQRQINEIEKEEKDSPVTADALPELSS
jgi:hypothetical protein